MIEIVIALAISLCIFLAILVYYSTAPFLLKLLSLPSYAVFLIFLIYLLVIMAGAPVKEYPEGSWKYVHHEIMLVDEEKTIFIWTYNDIGNRLHQIPYDRETAKKLEKAKNSQRNGFTQTGEFEPNGSGFMGLLMAEQSGLSSKDFIKQ